MYTLLNIGAILFGIAVEAILVVFWYKIVTSRDFLSGERDSKGLGDIVWTILFLGVTCMVGSGIYYVINEIISTYASN